MVAARFLVLASLFLAAAAWSRAGTSPIAGTAAAATLNRATVRCRVHADLDACYDAIRWNPGDPRLLVALGDALLRAKRPADAIHSYRRAILLAPNMHGVAGKISVAEAKLSAKRTQGSPRVERVPVNEAAGKRFSNAAPEAGSH